MGDAEIMDSRRYWIWLQQCLGEGARFKSIIEDFGSVENLYNANIIEWRQSPELSVTQVERLQKFSIEEADRIIEECERRKWEIITYDDALYPQRLREIPNPPAVLYVDGNILDMESKCLIAIVGTRKASSYALKAAHIMAKGISRCGAVVVSGGALGVDSAAHRGAISANAGTIAVLGCGFATDYLEANRQLREQIKLTGGALITEFPPHYKATRQSFPLRNRIISGLSKGVLVVEAGVKSGSLITASYAVEQDRDVYVIPASIFDFNFSGTNKLIDSGATVATSPSILIERYTEEFCDLDMSRAKTVRELLADEEPRDANAPIKQQVRFDEITRDRAESVKRQETAFGLRGNEKTVYEVLNQSFDSVDTICERAGLDAKSVSIALTMLEMKALVEVASGKRYRLK